MMSKLKIKDGVVHVRVCDEDMLVSTAPILTGESCIQSMNAEGGKFFDILVESTEEEYVVKKAMSVLGITEHEARESYSAFVAQLIKAGYMIEEKDDA